MLSQGVYTKLTDNTELEDGTGNEKFYGEADISVEPVQKRFVRWHYLSVFFGGILIGILLSTISVPVGNAILKASRKAHEKMLYKDAKDINEFYGFGHEPAMSDPVCGNSRQEAQANGCHYDIMASRWHPTECFHKDIMEEFLTEVEFDWYLDANYTDLVSIETARRGDHDILYPLHNYHILHCLYQFRRLHMAVIEHRQIDEDVFSYDHTLHCTKMIMQWPREIMYGKNTTTMSRSGVVHCIKPFL